MGFVRWFASNLSTCLDEEPDTTELGEHNENETSCLDEEPDTTELGEHNENETFEDLAASGTLVYPVLTEFTEDTDLPGTSLALIWGEGAWHLIGEDSGSPILQDDEVVYYLENLIAEATGFLSGFCKEHAIKSDLDLAKLQMIFSDSEAFQRARARRPKKGALAPVEEADSNEGDDEEADTEED